MAVGGCAPDSTGGPGNQPNQGLVEVATDVAVVKPLGVDLEAVGTAHANEAADVTSKTSNLITAIRFQEGSQVKAGEVLIELDSAEARATLAEAEATLADSERQFVRSRNLAATQALSASELDQIEATVKANRARVEGARARLSDTVIRAGFAGRTGFRRVSVGTVVNAGTVITTLDDASLIKLDFTVPDTYLFALRLGLPVKATTAGLRGKTFEGKITNIDSRVDPVTRSIFVRAEIPNRDGALKPGVFMNVSLQGDEQPALMVPEAAIVPEQGRAYVFVVVDGAAQRREVGVGRRKPGEVEVTSGLKEGERVVVDGTQNLRDKAKVHDQAPGQGGSPEAAKGEGKNSKPGGSAPADTKTVTH
ncbi:MAG TPA: efflux RND transporter periplasmic adaptor subunit [Steroidobacteraceae bacterium]|nr:efflux RND transporter periplasmic adaptor subunit [Steroidobacteraceae bacterium]